MWVLTIVIPAPKASALPLSVVIEVTPAVENEIADPAMMVPCIVVPPRIDPIVAALPTYQ
jgi:hypothetical protein